MVLTACSTLAGTGTNTYKVTSMESRPEHMESSPLPTAAADTGTRDKSQGELEQAVTQVWREAFQVDTIGPDDNFFELGGNSVLGMDLTELLASRLGVQIPVVMLFQHPTVREMTQIIIADAQS